MYLASKYEDIFPLNSRIISEKISHKALSREQVLKLENDFLNLFEFQLDQVTHYDFHHTLLGIIDLNL